MIPSWPSYAEIVQERASNRKSRLRFYTGILDMEDADKRASKRSGPETFSNNKMS